VTSFLSRPFFSFLSFPPPSIARFYVTEDSILSVLDFGFPPYGLICVFQLLFREIGVLFPLPPGAVKVSSIMKVMLIAPMLVKSAFRWYSFTP